MHHSDITMVTNNVCSTSFFPHILSPLIHQLLTSNNLHSSLAWTAKLKLSVATKCLMDVLCLPRVAYSTACWLFTRLRRLHCKWRDHFLTFRSGGFRGLVFTTSPRLESETLLMTGSVRPLDWQGRIKESQSDRSHSKTHWRSNEIKVQSEILHNGLTFLKVKAST